MSHNLLPAHDTAEWYMAEEHKLNISFSDTNIHLKKLRIIYSILPYLSLPQ